VQREATRSRGNHLGMRDLQARAISCNARPIARYEQVSGSSHSSALRIGLSTAVCKGIEPLCKRSAISYQPSAKNKKLIR
jgi:hypothetical protein